MVRDIIRADNLPDYRLAEEPGDIISVTRKDQVIDTRQARALSPETLEAARVLVPGADIYALEADWWAGPGRGRALDPETAFLDWVRAG